MSTTTARPNPVKKVRPAPAESPLEVLERTRRLFGMRATWAKGGYTRPSATWDNRRCLVSGLEACDGKHVAEAKKFALLAIKEIYPMRYTAGNIPSFNDSTATTKSDVIRVLDRAIELAEKGKS